MAVAESSWSTIQNQRRVKVYLDEVSQVSSTDTTVTYRLKGHIYSDYAASYGIGIRLGFYGDGHGNSAPDATWVLSTQSNGCYATRYVTLSRGSSATTATAYAEIVRCEVSGYGAWAGPVVEASTGVTVPHRTWYQPRPPKSFAASRSSDTRQLLTWAGDYTGMDGGYPWSGVYVERATDDGAFEQIATLSWSSTNYDDASTVAGHRYRYRARSYGPGGNSAYTDEIELFTTPAACTGVTASKPATGGVRLDCATRPAYADSYEFEASTDGGRTWAAATFEDWVCADPPKGTVTFRVRALKSSGGAGPVDLAAPWAESNQVATLCAPLAPLVSVPDVVATGTALTIAWTPNHPDATAQAMAQVEVTDQAGATTTTDVAGAATTLVRPAASQATAGSIRVRVRTHGEYDAWGEWSSYAVVRVAVAPKVAFASPTAGMTLAALPLSVAWAVTDETGVSEQSLSIADSSGATVWSSTPDNGVRSLTVGSEAGFINSTGYTLTYSMRAGSGLTLTKTIAFATEWAAPDHPNVTPTVGDGLSVELLVKSADTSPAAVSFDVDRVSPDGSRTRLATGIMDGQTALDVLPPLNTQYSYEVTAHAASGAVSTLSVPYTLDSDGHEALNFGSSARESLLLRYDATGSTSVKASGETFHFALGTGQDPLPAFYADGDLDVTGTHGYVLADVAEYRRATSLARKYADGWFRSAWGDVAVVRVEWSFGYDAKRYGQWTVDLSLTETMWEEPNRG